VNRGIVEILPDTLKFDAGYTHLDGTIALLGATLEMTQPLYLAGGLLTGWGIVAADVTNGGCIRPIPANGTLTIKGAYEQSLGGRMEFGLVGDHPAINQPSLNVTGSAILGGGISLLWEDGHIPAPGASFPVLTFASREGEFCCWDRFIFPGKGLRLEALYTASSLILNTVTAPEPASVPLHVAVDGSALICWPAEFTGYGLYWSTNLNASSWSLLPGVTNRFLEAPPLTSEKFFMLRKL
jgi:hypothetical protein